MIDLACQLLELQSSRASITWIVLIALDLFLGPTLNATSTFLILQNTSIESEVGGRASGSNADLTAWDLANET
jgi:hypothetical protein